MIFLHLFTDSNPLVFNFQKKGIFLNYSGDIHQSFSNKKNVPLAGGLFILIPLVFF